MCHLSNYIIYRPTVELKDVISYIYHSTASTMVMNGGYLYTYIHRGKAHAADTLHTFLSYTTQAFSYGLMMMSVFLATRRFVCAPYIHGCIVREMCLRESSSSCHRLPGINKNVTKHCGGTLLTENQTQTEY